MTTTLDTPKTLDRIDNQKFLDFISMATHDLKNPLMVIAGTADALRDREMPQEEYEECLNRLVRNMKSLQYLAGDLTDAVATHCDTCRMEFEILDLAKLAREITEDFAATCQAHPIVFEGDTACPVMGDAQRLTRMIANLLSNAVKYSAPDREINVAMWKSVDTVYLTIQDHGVGLSNADIERLFLPFERLDATSHMADGSGLGLSSVQMIVEAHGAEIEVQGKPREGTVVKVCFPLASHDN